MYELQVEGMSCSHCVSRVTKSVQALDSGAKVDVDLKSNTVRVDSSADLNAVTAAIAETGYPVTASTAV